MNIDKATPLELKKIIPQHTDEIKKQLNPCRCCGRTDMDVYHQEYAGDTYVDEYMIDCTCGISIDFCKKVELLMLWNRPHIPANHIDCIGVVRYAPNCPVHGGHVFSSLKKFPTIQSLQDYLMTSLLENHYIHQLWDNVNEMKESKFTVKYFFATHSVTHVEVRDDGDLLFSVKRDAYDAKKVKLVIHDEEALLIMQHSQRV